jgi:hypothetical protein
MEFIQIIEQNVSAFLVKHVCTKTDIDQDALREMSIKLIKQIKRSELKTLDNELPNEKTKAKASPVKKVKRCHGITTKLDRCRMVGKYYTKGLGHYCGRHIPKNSPTEWVRDMNTVDPKVLERYCLETKEEREKFDREQEKIAERQMQQLIVRRRRQQERFINENCDPTLDICNSIVFLLNKYEEINTIQEKIRKMRKKQKKIAIQFQNCSDDGFDIDDEDQALFEKVNNKYERKIDVLETQKKIVEASNEDSDETVEASVEASDEEESIKESIESNEESIEESIEESVEESIEESIEESVEESDEESVEEASVKESIEEESDEESVEEASVKESIEEESIEESIKSDEELIEASVKESVEEESIESDEESIDIPADITCIPSASIFDVPGMYSMLEEIDDAHYDSMFSSDKKKAQDKKTKLKEDNRTKCSNINISKPKKKKPKPTKKKKTETIVEEECDRTSDLMLKILNEEESTASSI